MKKEEVYAVFEQLGKALELFGKNKEWSSFSIGLTQEEFDAFNLAIRKEKQFNPWFTEENTRLALIGIAQYLTKDQLQLFQSNYSFSNQSKRVAIVMAGNIPLVGFHDLLCVLLSGNKAICKLSSTDNRLLLHIVQWLFNWNPEFKNRIQICLGPIKDYDAVIATGSNNSIQHFETYFGKVPHVFRKNRSSIAVLDGKETQEELVHLATDCFTFFGMGCRNVSKLFIPKGYNTDLVFEGLLSQKHLIDHHKYGNNYDYNRTVYLMNSIPFLDNNCVLLKEDEGLHAPLSVIFYTFYDTIEEVEQYIIAHEEEIQVVIGHAYTAFGAAQQPKINDFADNVDTMHWLNAL